MCGLHLNQWLTWAKSNCCIPLGRGFGWLEILVVARLRVPQAGHCLRYDLPADFLEERRGGSSWTVVDEAAPDGVLMQGENVSRMSDL